MPTTAGRRGTDLANQLTAPPCFSGSQEIQIVKEFSQPERGPGTRLNYKSSVRLRTTTSQ